MNSAFSRNLERGLLAVAVMLSLFLLAKTVASFKEIPAIGRQVPPTNVITVSGKGEVVSVPDIALFTVAVSEEALTVTEAQKTATDKINSIVKFLKELGVDTNKDVKTTNYSINPRYEYRRAQTDVIYPPYPDGRRTLVGYEVHHSLEVRLRKVEDAGKLLSGVGEVGVSSVYGPQFIVDKEDELRKEARELAIKDARVDAEKLSRSLGVRIIRLVSFNESGVYPIFYERAAAIGGKGGDALPEPQVPAGENKIVSNVTITYEIR